MFSLKRCPSGRNVLSTVAALLLAVSVAITVPVSATAPMLVRTVALDVSGYKEATDIDAQVKTAESAYAFIESTKPMMVRMEAIRRAYLAFGANIEARDKFMKLLKDRYFKNQNTANYFFDYGYAQMVMQADKNGLFFLRKANDKLANPATNLAYGLAQIDADRLFENAPPDSLTTRKMDVGYKLKDALAYNREDHLSGVWASYIRITEGIKDYAAYDSLRTEDVSTLYVPYGNTSVSPGANQFLALVDTTGDAAATASKTTAKSDVVATCKFSESQPAWSQLAASKTMDLNHDNRSMSINYYTKPDGKYQVRVTDPINRVVSEFETYKIGTVAEDLDADGKYELVVRQFDKDPYHPVMVYRWNGACFGEDRTISSYFK